MELALNAFYEAFPEHIVSVKPRPDGSVLMQLEKADEESFSRAIEVEDLFCAKRAGKIIGQIQRDMHLLGGDQFLKNQQAIKCDLPTYLGEPIHLRAMQKLVANRKIR
ncbi:DUF3509 domain-containing protein [Pseudomonas sp. LRF_L74]|uniref:DUF3509 domain-containing protein n=1 Tax=Pseudomonas sp. LRF_L74 TaxID=3369422 RepID=UPI003F62C6BC